MTRAHSHAFGSTEFDRRDDVDARFSPLSVTGRSLPVIYGGDDDRTAAAESIFHRLPDQGRPRRVWLDRYRAWHWSTFAPSRDLRLLAIDHRLPDADVLVNGDASTYASSRRAAASLVTANPDIDGLAWVSRQLHDRPSSVTVGDDTADLCLLLLGRDVARTGGVSRGHLQATGPAMPFATAAGLERLDGIGHELGITVVRT